MEREQIDQLYHLLRLAAVGDAETRGAVDDLSAYLCTGGPPTKMQDYLQLIDYLNWYGMRYLIQDIREQCNQVLGLHRYARIVDIGAGLGWLGKGLSAVRPCPYVLVDKRKWTHDTRLIDLEVESGMDELLSVLHEDDLLVMSEFLHCVQDPVGILHRLQSWDWVIVEYEPEYERYRESYYKQVESFGGNPFPELFGVVNAARDACGLSSGTATWSHVGPYRLAMCKNGARGRQV